MQSDKKTNFIFLVIINFLFAANDFQKNLIIYVLIKYENIYFALQKATN